MTASRTPRRPYGLSGNRVNGRADYRVPGTSLTARQWMHETGLKHKLGLDLAHQPLHAYVIYTRYGERSMILGSRPTHRGATIIANRYSGYSHPVRVSHVDTMDLRNIRYGVAS